MSRRGLNYHSFMSAVAMVVSGCVLSTPPSRDYDEASSALVVDGITCPVSPTGSTPRSACVNLGTYLPTGPSVDPIVNDAAISDALADLGITDGCCTNGIRPCGGTLFIPPGFYELSQPIRIGRPFLESELHSIGTTGCTPPGATSSSDISVQDTPRLHLTGAGRQTVLALKVGSPGPLIEVGGFASGTIVENLRLTGNPSDPECAARGQWELPGATNTVGILASGIGNSGKIKDVSICHFGFGILVDRTYLDDLDFVELKHNNVGFQGSANNATIYHDLVVTDNRKGVYFAPYQDNTVATGMAWEGGLVQNSTNAGMWIADAEFTWISGFMFRHNYYQPPTDMEGGSMDEGSSGTTDAEPIGVLFARAMSAHPAQEITVTNSYLDDEQRVAILNQSGYAPSGTIQCPYRNIAFEDISGAGLGPFRLDLHLPHAAAKDRSECPYEYDFASSDVDLHVDGQFWSDFSTPAISHEIYSDSNTDSSVVLLRRLALSRASGDLSFGIQVFGDGTAAVGPSTGDIQTKPLTGTQGLFVRGPIALTPLAHYTLGGVLHPLLAPRCTESADIGRILHLDTEFPELLGTFTIHAESSLFFCTSAEDGTIGWNEVMTQ